MIVDMNCWTGHWGTHPLRGEAEAVRDSLKQIGVDRLCLSPLDGVWAQNPHLANQAVYDAAERWDDVYPVPLLDPTVATWQEELWRARDCSRVQLVTWLPSYSQYDLCAADEWAEAIAEAGLGLIVQTRLEDTRRQHAGAVIPDVDPGEVAELARRHPDLTVIIGGAVWTAIRELAEVLLGLPNLYADVSQADGTDTMRILVEAGLTERLLFGTHAPFFVPLAGIARVITDVDDQTAAAILGGNATELLFS